MEGRNQFTFYRSFAEALRYIRKAADRAKAYDAICDYALYGIEPDMEALPDSAALALSVIKPILDSGNRKANAGKQGGSKPKQTASNEKANASKPEANSKQEKEQEQDKEQDKEQMLIPPTPFYSENRSKVISDYLNRVNPSASQRSLEELGGYAEDLGADVCIRAIDEAVDAKKANWNYLRAILRNLQAQGIKSLSDWDAREATREAAKNPKTADYTPGTSEIDSVAQLAARRKQRQEDNE